MSNTFGYMMRCIVATAMAFLLLAAPASVRADEGGDVTQVAGAVTWVGHEAVEVSGRRALVTSSTSISSDGRTISLASVVVGMPAELEMDDGGRAIELRVTGAVE